MTKLPLGEHELALLRFITDSAPISVGEVTEKYAASRGLARTTILTMMERLRKKGYLLREKFAGVYRYQPSYTKDEVMQSLVHNFTNRMLGGSLQPFLVYLVQEAHLSAAELQELRQLLETLESVNQAEDSHDDSDPCIA